MNAQIKNAIENAHLIIEQSIAVIRELDSPYPKRGEAYEYGYAQGRKDACRVLLLSFGVQLTQTSEDKEGE